LAVIEDIIKNVTNNNSHIVSDQLIELLSLMGTNQQELSDGEIIGFAFEIADWLFEKGETQAGANVYAAIFEKLKTLGNVPRFELARRLDQMAKHLEKAEHLAGAVEALKGAIELSRAEGDDADLDIQAVLWRLDRLATLQSALGNHERAAETRAEYEKLASRSGQRELAGRQTVDLQPIRPAPYVPYSAPTAGLEVPEASPFDYRSLEDQLAEVPAGDRWLKVPVFFATHREPHELQNNAIYDPYDRFGHEQSNTLNFGRSIVTVPADRVTGSYEEPGSSWNPFGNGGKLEKSFTVQSVDLIRDQNGFVTDVKKAVQDTTKKELLLFVHGYWTSLATGMMRAAQLKVDMKIEGAVMLYSLPSMNKMLGYVHDRGAAVDPLAHEQLRDLLLELSRETGANRFHFVAHSLGSEMLMRTLNEVWKSVQSDPERHFDEVIFAAPDVDHQDFIDIVPRVTSLASRVTVYASESDLPLSSVSWLVGRDRAGFDAAQLAGIAHVDAIDTTGGSSWITSFWNNWGHWDFADDAVDDMRAVVWLSLMPKGRNRLLNALARSGDGALYWVVKTGGQVSILRKALEWARSLGLGTALDTANSAAQAEADMVPPGERLAEYQVLHEELQLFSDHIFERQPDA